MPLPDFEPTVAALLSRSCLRSAQAPLISLGDRRLRYGDADAASAELARALLADGVGKGTRIGLLFPNGPDWLVAFLAAARVGAVAVPINTFQQPRELGWMLRHADVDTLLTCDRLLSHDYLSKLEACAPGLATQAGLARDEKPGDGPARGPRLLVTELPYLRRVIVWGADHRAWTTPAARYVGAASRVPAAQLAAVEAEVTPSDTLLILYSSGSTAEPKGAVHTHGSLVRHAANMNALRDLAADDVIYSPMPFFWVGGLVFTLLSAMHVGASLVCEERFEPADTLALLERERVTVGLGWPHYAKAMAEHPSFAERKLAIRAGNLYDLLPGAAEIDAEARPNSLGMTETCGPHTFDRMDEALPPALRGSFGRALPGVEHRIVAPGDRQARPLATGESGEIAVRGYSLAQGLYKREREETFAADGFYLTGDGGRFTEDGHLFFEGRLGDLIKTGGANVTPREVELVLETFDDVAQAFVVGVRHPERGENVACAVIPAPGRAPTVDDLRARAKETISAYKVPRHVWIAEASAMPMTDSGKPDKKALRALLEEKIAAGEVA